MAGPLEQFVIKPIIPIEISGIDLSITNSTVWMGLGFVVATVLTAGLISAKEMVPGRLQNIPEMLYDFIAGIVQSTLGKEGSPYFPLIFTIFMTVLMGNLLGLIPMSFTYTSHIIVTGALALFVFFLATAIGFWRHGLHFFSLFLPKGLPWVMAPLIVVIELISYLSRPVSLSVRLFANMLAGHMMLKVFAGFSVSMGIFFGLLPMVLNVALVGLELMIAFIQAYVFAILTCVYLKDAIELH